MLRTLINNLSRAQKIGILVILQIIIIIILALVVKSLTAEKSHVAIESNEAELSESIPDNAESFIEDSIWQVIKNKVVGADRNDVDVVIREGTYVEDETEDGYKVEFIVDIDSLKQSFVVRTGWSKNKDVVYEVIVDCPPQDKMKYPETVCNGTYNNTFSLDLYLPYIVYPEGYDDNTVAAPNYMISGDENTKTLDIMISECDVEGFKKAAWDYLNSLPIDFSEYQVNYEINKVDVRC